MSARYVIRKCAVHSFWGIWDVRADSWYEGEGEDDSFYFAGIAFWSREKQAEQFVAELGA